MRPTMAWAVLLQILMISFSAVSAATAAENRAAEKYRRSMKVLPRLPPRGSKADSMKLLRFARGGYKQTVNTAVPAIPENSCFGEMPNVDNFRDFVIRAAAEQPQWISSTSTRVASMARELCSESMSQIAKLKLSLIIGRLDCQPAIKAVMGAVFKGQWNTVEAILHDRHARGLPYQGSSHQTHVRFNTSGWVQHRLFLQRWLESSLFDEIYKLLRGRRLCAVGMLFFLSQMTGLGAYTAKNIVTAAFQMNLLNDWSVTAIGPGAVCSLKVLAGLARPLAKNQQGVWPWASSVAGKKLQAQLMQLANLMSTWLGVVVQLWDCQGALCYWHKICTGAVQW